jgi:hypothetical protein
MHGLKSTLVLLVALAGLVGYIYFVDSEQPPDAADALPKAFDVSPENIEEVQIRTIAGENARVQRIETSWQVVEPMTVAADAVQVASVTSSLANLEVQRVVDENPTDLGQYGLNPPRLEVSFRVKDESDVRRLLIGEKTPTGENLYAKTPGENRVFLIASFLDATFNKSAFDFRDKSVIEFDSATVTALDIARGGDTLQFTRNDNDWRMVRPLAVRADYAGVEGIMTRLSSAQMQRVVVESAENLRQYGLDQPALSVTIANGSSRATLLIGSSSGEGGLYAKDASRPMVFTVEESLATDLRKETTEFRRKELFDARSYTTNRIELRHGGQAQTFEKTTSDGKEVWRNAAGVNVDSTLVDDMLTQLMTLRALSFTPDVHPSIKTPMLTVTVRFDTDRMETVTFGREGADGFASRADEPGSGLVPASLVEEVIKKADGVK